MEGCFIPVGVIPFPPPSLLSFLPSVLPPFSPPSLPSSLPSLLFLTSQISVVSNLQSSQDVPDFSLAITIATLDIILIGISMVTLSHATYPTSLIARLHGRNTFLFLLRGLHGMRLMPNAKKLEYLPGNSHIVGRCWRVHLLCDNS